MTKEELKKEAGFDFENEKECFEAVKHFNDALKYIENQTPELCMAAVCCDLNELNYVKNLTPELCMAAVKENGFAITFVPEQFLTFELCKIALENSEGDAIECINPAYQTPELCMMAVDLDPKNLHGIYPPNRTADICMAAVSKSAEALEFVRDQTIPIFVWQPLHKIKMKR